MDELRELFARSTPSRRWSRDGQGGPRLATPRRRAGRAPERLGAPEEPLARPRRQPPSSVTFSAGALTIDIEVQADGPRRTLLGQLSPPARATIEVETATDARFSAQSDRLGRFRLQLPG